MELLNPRVGYGLAFLASAVLILVLGFMIFQGPQKPKREPDYTPRQFVLHHWPKAIIHGVSWADRKQPVVIATIGGIRGYFIFNRIDGRWAIVYAAPD